MPSKPARTPSIFFAQRCGLAAIAAAYWGNTLRTAIHPGAGGLAAVTGGVLQNGAFCAAAWAMLAALLWRPAPAGPGRRADLALLAGACLVAAIPARQAAMLAMLLAAVHFARIGTPPARATMVLLLGLALEAAWTSAYALPLHAAWGQLDAAVVRALLGAGGIGNVVSSTPSAFSIEVLAPCASSFPLGAVALAYAVVRIFEGALPDRHDLPWLAAAWLTSAALTEGRLALMAQDPGTYHWLHEGGGVTLYTLVATAAATAFPLLAGSGRQCAAARPA